jgi:Ca-activated chloride channel family protein
MRHSFLALSLIAFTGCFGSSQKKDDKKIIVDNTVVAVPQVDPLVVNLDADLANDYMTAGATGEMLVRLRLTTNDLERAHRAPVNLSLVVDTSGSMDGEAIDAARTASLELVDALADGDFLAVVVFHSKTEVLVPSTRIDKDTREAVRAQIEQMTARGTTDLTGGLVTALQQVYTHHNAEGVNRIVLLSDGVPNDATHVQQYAQEAGNAGIAITALGLGVEYDETLLGAIAQTSGGRFHYIDDSEKVAGVFRDEVLRLQRVVARNLTLALRPGPGIALTEVVGFAAQPAGDGQSYVHLGDLSEGQQRDIVVRLNVKGHKDGATIELMDGVITFDDAVDNAGRFERSVFMSARSTADQDEIAKGRNLDVEASAERARAAAATVLAIATARAGQLPQAHAILDEAEPRARQAAAQFEDDTELLELADAMLKLRDALPSVMQQAQGAVVQPSPDPHVNVGNAMPEDAPATVRETHSIATDALQGN